MMEKNLWERVPSSLIRVNDVNTDMYVQYVLIPTFPDSHCHQINWPQSKLLIGNEARREMKYKLTEFIREGSRFLNLILPKIPFDRQLHMFISCEIHSVNLEACIPKPDTLRRFIFS